MNNEDFVSSTQIYKEIKNIDFFKVEDICYNLYYNNTFINNFFKNLYRILDTVEDGAMIVDKNFNYLKLDDVIKFVFHIKRKLISPLLIEIFGDKEKLKKQNRINFMELMRIKAEEK